MYFILGRVKDIPGGDYHAAPGVTDTAKLSNLCVGWVQGEEGGSTPCVRR
jgi:hypothetical protein